MAMVRSQTIWYTNANLKEDRNDNQETGIHTPLVVKHHQGFLKLYSSQISVDGLGI